MRDDGFVWMQPQPRRRRRPEPERTVAAIRARIAVLQAELHALTGEDWALPAAEDEQRLSDIARQLRRWASWRGRRLLHRLGERRPWLRLLAG